MTFSTFPFSLYCSNFKSVFIEVDSIFTDVNSADKTLMEKLRLIDILDDQEKQSLFNIVDSLVAKKKLKDNLTNVLQLAQ